MDILQEIGLSEREAQIYRLLLKLGEVPVNAVLKATGMHPQVVYRVIDSLEDKGLLISVKRKSRTYISAESPKRLERIQEEKLDSVRESIPGLLALQKHSKDAIVRVSKGEEAVRLLRMRGIDELKRNDTYHIIGGSGDRYYKAMDARHEEIERKRIKKKIFKKLIAFHSQKEKFEQDRLRTHSEFRFLPDEYPVASSTNIFASTVAIIIWEAEPIVITIESDRVAESYRHYFNALWRIATA